MTLEEPINARLVLAPPALETQEICQCSDQSGRNPEEYEINGARYAVEQASANSHVADKGDDTFAEREPGASFPKPFSTRAFGKIHDRFGKIQKGQ